MVPSFSGRYHLFFFSSFLLYLYAYSKRSGSVRTKKGKNKEMPPEYAAYFLVLFSIEQRDQWWMR
ncbi:unnamed protein product [Brassica rapa]|uniref:Uncharacterized protein n=1 Tax=Brassica campestris TaxID=3711 RepID=A0A3P5YI39_BRACM|nr:unnamed protein product [Brassica rapa]VDC67316.1 unnamed protein product [Brassica rapa]